MKLLLPLLCLLPVIFAVPPVWYKNGACGKSKYPDAGDYMLPAPTIVGGIKTRPNEFPWQISLKVAGRHNCGGSIINEFWILTAAHCLTNKQPAILTVGVGEQILSSPSATSQNYTVEKIISHPKYNSFTKIYDFGLVKVKTPIKISENVAPVCAPEYTDLFVHKKVAVSGWGATKFGGSGSNELLYTTLNTTTNAYCQQKYPTTKITDDMICASDNSNNVARDSCQGDSGGPLAIKSANKIFSVVGVVSWGKGCASSAPGVYGRVNYVNDWITESIK